MKRTTNSYAFSVGLKSHLHKMDFRGLWPKNVFLAISARFAVFPYQIGFVLAYLQANKREHDFVLFPKEWKQFTMDHLHKWLGRPVRLAKALYAYNYLGKFLYQDQAEFLQDYGFETTGQPGLWVKHTYGRFGEVSYMLFLHYVDDILVMSTNDKHMPPF